MRLFGSEFTEANNTESREPRYAIKINNDLGAFWLVSHADVATGGVQYECVISTGVTSQQITPEQGISVLGGMSIACTDNGLTAKLRAILASNDTLVNNRGDVYVGYNGLAFADYELLATYWVDGVDNDIESYTLRFIDTQRFIKRSIFTKKETLLFQSFDTADTLATLEVISTADFATVEHDANWADAANSTVGYIKVKGVDENGSQTHEIMRYTGKTATTFTGVTRGVLGSNRIAAKGTEDDVNTQIEEFIYLDLSAPKMLLAVMTGDLYGQPGKTIPSHWHAGLSADKYSLASFEDHNDLDSVMFSFMNPKKTDAKQWLSNQILRPIGAFLQVDQNGELALKRFSAVPQKAAPSGFVDEDNCVSFSGIKRDAKAIKNRFEFLWEWRQDIEKYARRSIFVDQDSIDRNNFTSDILTVKLDGIRNRSQSILTTLEQLAEGIRARYSDPTIKASATVFLSDALQYEVGDLVRVKLPYPDYNGSDTLDATMEIQGTSVDFTSGTMTLQLFGTAGIPTGVYSTNGADVTALDHTGWTALPTGLTGAYTNSGGTLTITGAASITGGATTATGRYWYNGNIVINSGAVLTTTLNTTIDCQDITLVGTGKITSKGNGLTGGTGMIAAASNWTGVKGQQGFVGGKDNADEGIDRIWGFFGTKISRDAFRSSGDLVASTANSAFNIKLSVNASNQIVGLPNTLMGSSGSGGGRARYITNATGTTTYAKGGNGGKSGGGIVLVCENLFTDASSVIDTSGADGSLGDSLSQIWAGSGGSGFPGALVVLIKSRVSPMPTISSNVVADTGSVPVGALLADGLDGYSRVASKGAWQRRDYTWLPHRTTAQAATIDADLKDQAYIARYLVKDQVAAPIIGADTDGKSELPTALTLTETLNTPPSPLGDLSTITMTVTPPSDANYSYSKFQYRLSGSDQWVDISYGVRNEATVTVSSDGTAYEFSAQSVSKSGIVSTGRLVQSITTTTINADTPQDPIVYPEIGIPEIKRLELVNRIDDDTGWDKWKSPNAEFRWASLSISSGGTIILPSGNSDLILKGYKARIIDSSGNVVREEFLTDPIYTYSFEKNKRDGVGRSFTFEVMALATTGQHSEPVSIAVSNPAPAAPSNVTYTSGFTSIGITFDLPTDYDFVGVDLYSSVSPADPLTVTPVRLSGNSFMLEGLSTGETYSIVLTSVDEFGVGSSTTEANIVTRTISATADIDGLSVWAVTDSKDAAFIASYIETGSIVESLLASGSVTNTKLGDLAVDAGKLANSSVTATKIANLAVGTAAIQDLAVTDAKIGSLTAAKITAGDITVTVDIGDDPDTNNGVRLDGANGVIHTVNSGYDTYLGAVSRPTIDATNPLILHSWDGASSPFWINSAGDAHFAGNIDAATGSFGGSLSAASGTFTGSLTAASGTFTGTVSAGNVVGGLVSSAASPTFGDDGYQLGDFSGTKKFHVGTGNKYIQFDGTDFNVGSETEIGSTVGVTVTVHQTTGDYASISAALEGLSKLYKGYKYGGVQSKILIKSGYIESVGVDARDVNLGWITIDGDTGVTSYSIDPVLSVGVGIYAFDGCSAPTWKILPNDTRTTYISGSLFYAYRSRLYVSCFIGNAYTIRRPFLDALDSFVVVGALDIEVGGRLTTCDATVLTINSSNIRTPALGANTFSGTITMNTGSTLNANNVTMYNTAANGSDFSINYGSVASILNCSKVSGSSSNYITAYQSTVGIFGYSSAGTYTTYGLLAQLSTVSAQSCTFRRGGGSDESSNIRCDDGSTIRVKSVGGGTNITKNSTASLSNGMIIGT